MSPYLPRIVDAELDGLLPDLPAISLEGPKGVGKTATALRRASTVLRLDDPEDRQLLGADPGRLERDTPPVLVDEWQRMPESWDLVRRQVDADARGGRFLLTGSASPASPSSHSGAGRIVRLRLRPMSLAERGLPNPPTVSLSSMLAEKQAEVTGRCDMDLPAYVEEILASGFPSIRGASARARLRQLDGYLDRIVDADFPELGHRVVRPATLRAWLSSYAAATATTASYNRILDAATPGEADPPAKTTTIAYRDTLDRLWLLDPVPGWVPGQNHLKRLASAPKHHLADPALAARLLGSTASGLLRGHTDGRPVPRDGALVGALFESLVTLSVRCYAQAAEATVHHLRTRAGEREVDLIVQGPDHRIVALEVKLATTVGDDDVRHLHWLAEHLGSDVADLAVITCGAHAYRRRDGVAVIPAALLGA